MDETRFRQMVQKLIDLTNQDKVKWFWHGGNLSKTKYNNRQFLVDFLRDEPPTLMIHDSEIKIRGYGIEELLKAVDNQYKRLKVHKYDQSLSPEEVAFINLLEDRKRIIQERESSARLESEVFSFLLEEGVVKLE